jgi:small membrane protein
MRPSQIVLLLLVLAFATYIFKLRSTSGDRLTYLGLAALGIGLILNPELTNRVAAQLGVGRGADLMFYFFIIFALFHFATTAATIRRLQRDVTRLSQALALASPQRPELPPAATSGVV